MNIPRSATLRKETKNTHPIIVEESCCASRHEPFHGLKRTLSSTTPSRSDRKVVIERVSDNNDIGYPENDVFHRNEHNDALTVDSAAPSPTRTYQRIDSVRSRLPTECFSKKQSLDVAQLTEMLAATVPILKEKKLHFIESKTSTFRKPFGGLKAHNEFESSDTADTQDSYWTQLKRIELRNYQRAQFMNRRRRIRKETAEYDEMMVLSPPSLPSNF